MKNNRMILLAIIISLISLSVFDNTDIFAYSKEDYSYSQEGTFYYSNTSNSVFLLEDDLWDIGLGAQYNITIFLNKSSSSQINITYHGFFGVNWWEEGPLNFLVNPGENRSVLYVQHAKCDNYGSFNFWINLVNTTGTAFGTYQANLVFSGYDVDVGTGCTYVKNLTVWLEAKSRIITTTSLPYKDVGITIFLGVISILLIRKRRSIF